MTMSLYSIAHEYRAVVDHLMDVQTDEQAIADTLEAEAYPLELKAQNAARAAWQGHQHADRQAAEEETRGARRQQQRTTGRYPV